MTVIGSELPSPAPGVVFKELGDSAVLYCARTEVYFGLNELGSTIWTSLPPVLRTFDDLLTRLIERFPHEPSDVVRNDIAEFLNSLVENGLAVR